MATPSFVRMKARQLALPIVWPQNRARAYEGKARRSQRPGEAYRWQWPDGTGPLCGYGHLLPQPGVPRRMLFSLLKDTPSTRCTLQRFLDFRVAFCT